MSQAKYYLLLLLVCLIWGATPASGKFTVEAFSPLMITGSRFACIALVLFICMVILKDYKGLKPSKDVLKIAFALGFMGVLVHNGLLFYGLQLTTATNTALIESIGPTATTILAFFFLGERLNRYGWMGIAISCLGAVCIISKGSLDVLLNLSFNIGDIYIIICEIAWSAYSVISRNINGKCSTIAITAWSGLFGSILCYATGFATDSLHIYKITSEALWGFSYLVIFSGIFAFVAWNFAVQKVGASKAGVFIYLVPLTGGIVGVTLLGEEILPAQIIGALFIIGGVIITIKSKVVMRQQSKTPEQLELEKEVNLLKRFPELAHKHNTKLIEKGVITPEQNTFDLNKNASDPTEATLDKQNELEPQKDQEHQKGQESHKAQEPTKEVEPAKAQEPQNEQMLTASSGLMGAGESIDHEHNPSFVPGKDEVTK